MYHAIISRIVLSVLVLSATAVGQSTRPEDSPANQDAVPAIPVDAMDKARALQAEDRWIEASDLYLQITETQPANGAAWFNLGYCLHMAGELDLAINAHRKAATFEQYTGIALYNLGCAFALLGEVDDAFEALHAAHEAGFNVRGNLDTDPDLKSLRDDERFDLLRKQTAADGPAATFEQGKQSVLAILRQARQYLAQNGPALMEQAKAMAQQAAGLAQQKYHELQEMAEDDDQIAELRARLQETFARAHEAFLQWRQSVEREESPNQTQSGGGVEAVDSEAMMAEADQHFQRGAWREAAAAYRAVVDVDHENGRAWFALGYSLHAEGQLDEAIDAHRRAAEFEQFKGIGLYNLACALSLKGDVDDAFEALARCREAGFDRLSGMVDDSDFDNIRDDERYAEFVASLDHDDSV